MPDNTDTPDGYDAEVTITSKAQEPIAVAIAHQTNNPHAGNMVALSFGDRYAFVSPDEARHLARNLTLAAEQADE